MKKIKNILTVVLSAVLILCLCVTSALLPDEAYSKSERRLLNRLPQISFSSIKSGSFMTGFEKYALDSFAFRDFFRTLKAKTVLNALKERDNGGIYLADSHLSRLDYTVDLSSVTYAASRFSAVCDMYFRENYNIYLSVIPDKNRFIASRNGYPDLDYDALISTLCSEFKAARYIDITGTLSKDSYYLTDTHWRQEMLESTAKALLSGMNATAYEKLSKVSTEVDFLGVYAGQSALNPAPEMLYYLENEVIKSLKGYDFEDDTAIPIYDISAASGRDPYEMFLGGAKSVITVTNENAGTKRELVIFRDSFGSSIAPLLTAGYAKTTLIDIRYISPSSIERFLPQGECDVLFLYSTSVLNSSETIK